MNTKNYTLETANKRNGVKNEKKFDKLERRRRILIVR